ncbi:DUF1700 domain-containing protein [Macrococcoides bohemicum]|uniref:DUF1700 domain-containing protein n=1 Tax=Macrococcoides bohemicum TaxID=1903056 RepID=UPI00165E444D|nr:DUF1700 domain-containing protein [Macrococcus bohemicus]MBC9873249.1 DUF1700 domain-containing protein [Macrococcus bohemicus]
MDQNLFLAILRKEIKNIPENEVNEIINEYINHFNESKLDGISEVEAAYLLGDPKEIAKEINYTFAINRFKRNPSIKNSIILMTNIALLSLHHLFFAILALITFIFLFPLILGSLIATPFMLLSPLYLLYLFLIDGPKALTFANIFEVVKGVILGLLLLYFYIFLFKNFNKLFIRFIEWNKNFIQRRKLK